ncbi:MAG: LuxR C-terminal-related transcriptional regulator [Sandaracinaceae bacterium]|nr:LuxR C-terminal-related transcriptional regulator [Sandaracinaceae bacterium]
MLRELARGLTYEQVAVVLGVSANTVRAHVRSIYEKLDAATRTEAVLTAIRMGLIDV